MLGSAQRLHTYFSEFAPRGVQVLYRETGSGKNREYSTKELFQITEAKERNKPVKTDLKVNKKGRTPTPRAKKTSQEPQCQMNQLEKLIANRDVQCAGFLELV